MHAIDPSSNLSDPRPTYLSKNHLFNSFSALSDNMKFANLMEINCLSQKYFGLLIVEPEHVADF